MTRKEAIAVLDKMPLCSECDPSNMPYPCVDCEDAFLMAIEALKQPEIVKMTNHKSELRKRVILCIEMVIVGCSVLYGIIYLLKLMF